MTLTQLISRVRFLIDEPTPQNFTDSDITLALNVAQQDVSKEIVHIYEDYFEKQADLNPAGGGTIAGTEFYTLPSDFLKFKRIERTDTGEPLTPIDQNEKQWNNFGLVTVVTSTMPLSYYVTGNSLGLNPVPQTVIPIRMTYNYRLPDMDTSNPGTSDVSQIPAEHHDMMAVRAAIDVFLKDQEDTGPLELRWDFLLDQMHRTLRQRQTQTPKHVRRVTGSYGPLV